MAERVKLNACLARSENRSMTAGPPLPAQPRNPLHGLTLETILTRLVERYGWPGLAERLPVRCFQSDPSVSSSLKFLRRTPWAREKVESLYLFMLREQRRGGPG
jgi:uncharacterized protein (DUF2132 family)